MILGDSYITFNRKISNFRGHFVHTAYPVTPNAGMFYQTGINTYGAEIHKVRKHAIHAFPSFLFLILLFRLYVQEPFSEIMERQNNRLV